MYESEFVVYLSKNSFKLYLSNIQIKIIQ